MMSTDTRPGELPIAGERPPERSDAAANRQRILDAARSLIEEQGFEGLTMDAVAAAAGVGKGTIFRRFGDRSGLTEALLDDFMREFQDAFLSGPPPLGPGAPAAARLEAFVLELVRCQTNHIGAAVAAEVRPGATSTRVAGTLHLHVVSLLEQIDPRLDHRALAGMILAATSPSVLYRLQGHLGATPEEIERSAVRLLRGVTAGRG